MGTRAIVRIFDEDNAELLCLYRQYDGYLEGLGQELADFASQFTVVNGLRGGDTRKLANGMSCFAAQLVAHLKKSAGNVYIYPVGTKDVGEEFTYILSHPDGGSAIHMEASEGPVTAFGMASKSGTNHQLFDGPCTDFKAEWIPTRHH